MIPLNLQAAVPFARASVEGPEAVKAGEVNTARPQPATPALPTGRPLPAFEQIIHQPLAHEISRLSLSERTQIQSAVSGLVNSLAQFQGHSRPDSSDPQLFLSIPYGQEQLQRELQVFLRKYTDKDQQGQAVEDQPASWLFSLLFELDVGRLLIKARFQEGQLQLTCLPVTRVLQA